MEDNVVLVGRKPVSAYILSVSSIALKKMEKIILKARGKSICKAVDVAEISKNKFITDYKIGKIETGTSAYEIETDRGKEERNVSEITIELVKKKDV